MSGVEINFDGLVGPTHNYSGLSHGNLASSGNAGRRSNPRAAALQGLAKMRALLEMGIPQAVLPPQERPFVPALRALGFSGADHEVVARALAADPALLANASSASAMWAANAATVSPAADCGDGRLHLTVANLAAMPHRSLEPPATARALRAAFPDRAMAEIHDQLPHAFGDEGAANHCRIAAHHGAPGLELFVHGRAALSRDVSPGFPARQTLEASEAVARRHGLDPARTLFVPQSPRAIAAGAFHNDVVCVSNERVMMFHEHAFDDPAAAMERIRAACAPLGFAPVFLMARAARLPLEDAVRSYLFNGQIVTRPDGAMVLVLPVEARETPSAADFARACVAGDNPIADAIFLDVRESMRNGGGPACLRLRVQMAQADQARIHAPLVMTPARLDALGRWVEAHYRDRLAPEDLGDPALLTESHAALDALTGILGLGAFYDFQREPGGNAA